ncbi:MAG: VCBS repeat-containing protein [Saprospiraceae bacterium]|nr:VCBS repeat-containing protein [Saprospiraceae bacterium]
MRWIVGLLGIALLFACNKTANNHKNEASLFTLLSADETGIDFINQLSYTEEFNPYTFRNFYNGGGVGLGDINNDGLVDIFFCGNRVDNKLYLNKGNFTFEDITTQAGVASSGVWSSGVSFADVNGDGWLDIYVCKSGDPKGENRHNELFINNKDLTFTEKAKEYGIADLGLSTHAAFFDYDKDGDLDLYLLNNSIRSVGGYDLRPGQREIRDSLGGNKLYRNEGERFTDISVKAGIYGSNIGFGLGVTIGDVNRDGWQDIYVSNDFFERDYLYINKQNGTFTESLENQIREISLSSMGADMADINNDGYPEIFVTDMLPEDDARMKTKTTFENWDKYQLNIRNGYYKQFTRNVLQLNNGDGTFSEIGRLAGVNATDWSWGALIADLDNDGWKDIFVANGIYKDLTDQDYINFYSDPNTIREILRRENAVIKRMIDTIPSQAIPNYAFHNNGDLTFTNKAKEWGLDQPGFSNGSVYGDLDNDGDLDLVTNNVNMPPFIYKNNAEKLLQNTYISLQLQGEAPNVFGLGAQVTLWSEGKTFYQELAPMRGFESCVDHRLHFGLGKLQMIDSLQVIWPNGQHSFLQQVSVNQLLTLKQSDASPTLQHSNTPTFQYPNTPIFQNITNEINLSYQHQENEFSDFDRDRLLYQMYSCEGPRIAKADVNGDGREDVFIGGAKDMAGTLFMQQASGTFRQSNQALFEVDKISEDTDSEFFDADGDGDQDLYVASGGNEFPTSSSALIDRLYLNDGKGNFIKSPQILPTFQYESTGCVKASDFDGDGDMDLFVGIRLIPFLYGVPTNGYILQNDGKGNFIDVTASVAPELKAIGMITDAVWEDYDKDGKKDLIIVGDWMPITILQNSNGKLKKLPTSDLQLPASNGFWNCIKSADLDNDGDKDFIIGNHGLNTRFKASENEPITMYVNDFDRNGTAEQLISVYNGGKSYPLALRHDLVMQMPGLKKKYLKYESYKNQTVQDIFTPTQLQGTVEQKIYTTQTSILLNQGDGKFGLIPLPLQAQLAPMYGLWVEDFDDDGNKDIIMGGNFYYAKPEVGIYDASYGLFLKGNGKGGFQPLSALQSGFFVKGEVRDMVSLKIGNRSVIVVTKNNARAEIFEIKNDIQ